MDFNALVSEIVARVAAKMEDSSGKPGLLILTPQHGEACHAMLESPRLREYYKTDCALLNEYQVSVEDYEAVILFGLSNESLARLAGGVCDTPFTALAQKAILAGKRIFVCEDEIELLRYQQSAPPAYYRMLSGQLALLTASGVTVCPCGSLEDMILSGSPAPCTKPLSLCACTASGAAEVRIDKKIVTERDMAALCDRSTVSIRVSRKTILTDLARDWAQARKISVVRDD